MNLLKMTSIAAIGLIGCGEDTSGPSTEPVSSSVKSSSSSVVESELPTTYNFSNISFGGQTTRLDMLAEITTLAKTGNEQGVQVSAARLKAMYANDTTVANRFEAAELNDIGVASKVLKSKTWAGVDVLVEAWMDSLELASQNTEAGEAGLAGVVYSKDGAKSYLQGANGFEYTQLIEKTLMGAVNYNQAVNYYLNVDEKIAESIDNEEVTEGKGTALQHHWDEGFGYFTSDVTYPNHENKRFWAKYSGKVTEALKTDENILKAFIKGRHAIDNKDRATMVIAADEVIKQWELVIAGIAIHYLNEGKEKLAAGESTLANHALSEAYGLIKSLEYNANATISKANVDAAIKNLGDSFYTISSEQIDSAKGIIAEAFDLTSHIHSL
jgi:hypothetical protein